MWNLKNNCLTYLVKKALKISQETKAVMQRSHYQDRQKTESEISAARSATLFKQPYLFNLFRSLEVMYWQLIEVLCSSKLLCLYTVDVLRKFNIIQIMNTGTRE